MLDKVKTHLSNFLSKAKEKFTQDKNKLESAYLIRTASFAVAMLAIAGTASLFQNDKFTERNSNLNASETTIESDQNDAELDSEIALYLDEGHNRSSDELNLTKKTKETTKAKETKEKSSATTQTTAKATTNTSVAATTTTAATTAAKTVTVAAGEGWWHVGERAGVDYRYLAVFNGKNWNENVYTGQVLKVPTAEELAKIELPVETAAPTHAQANTSSAAQATQAPVQSAAPAASSAYIYSVNDLIFHGRINWSGMQYTFYSQSVLPGHGLNIPGRHVSAAGFVCDGDGYIVLASDYYARGTVISTPFGAPGKVYDAFGTGQPSWRFDVYIR